MAACSGREVVVVQAEPSWRLGDFLQAIPEPERIGEFRLHMFLGEFELRGNATLSDIGADDGSEFTLVKTEATHRWWPTAVQAANTQHWSPAIHWAMGEALNAVDAYKADCEEVLQLTMFEGGPSVRDWLLDVLTSNEYFPWPDAASAIVARAYERTLHAQRQCLHKDKRHAIAKVTRCMRDVVVLAAISDAGGHGDQDLFDNALSAAFRRPLDYDTNAQMKYSYHYLLHDIEGAFVSGSRRSRLRYSRYGGYEGFRAATADLGDAARPAAHGS